MFPVIMIFTSILYDGEFLASVSSNGDCFSNVFYNGGFLPVCHILVNFTSAVIFQYMLRLAKEATVEALKESLQKKTAVNPKNVNLCLALCCFVLVFFSPF